MMRGEGNNFGNDKKWGKKQSEGDTILVLNASGPLS
jgi:hypothetical protein